MATRHSRLDRRRFLRSAAGAVALAAASGLARAQQPYPSRHVRWVIYQSPGGLIDTSSRMLQPFILEQGIETVFDYIRGASGRIARAQLARAKPDGYTIMTEALPEEVLGEVVYNADYKVKDLQPVVGWFVNAFNLYVRKDSKMQTFEDLLRAARGGRVTVATLGHGGPSHLQVMLLRSALNVDLVPVPFAGGAPAMQALLGGHVDVAIGGSSSARSADKLHFLGVFRDGRDPALPATPTLAEMGHKVANVNEVIYISTTAGVPADRLQRLTQVFSVAIQNPAQIEKQKGLGVFPRIIPAAELRTMIQAHYGFVSEYKSELVEK
jgi:tripartite-type tricarboxylate transporter receptor subunit TctC